MRIKSVGLREIGVVITLASVITVLLAISFLDTLGKLTQQSCTCGDTCGMVKYETPSIIYVGLAGACVMFLVGVVLFVRGGRFYGEANKNKAWTEKLKTLEGDEGTVYKIIMDSDGTVFQSEIVEKTGWSKVKISRTLDKLESMRLLERRRRGLTNIIVLKD